MGIASHLSWAHFLQCKLHFSRPNPFFVFSLQGTGFYGDVKILLDGNIIAYIKDTDSKYGATITGTATATMDLGQEVSDSLLFCCMKLTTTHYLYQSKVHPKYKTKF